MGDPQHRFAHLHLEGGYERESRMIWRNDQNGRLYTIVYTLGDSGFATARPRNWEGESIRLKGESVWKHFRIAGKAK